MSAAGWQETQAEMVKGKAQVRNTLLATLLVLVLGPVLGGDVTTQHSHSHSHSHIHSSGQSLPVKVTAQSQHIHST